MGEALFPKAQRGYVKIHRWKKYNVVSTTTYYWNRYNAVSTTIYKWNKWNTVTGYARSFYMRLDASNGGMNFYDPTPVYSSWVIVEDSSGNLGFEPAGSTAYFNSSSPEEIVGYHVITMTTNHPSSAKNSAIMDLVNYLGYNIISPYHYTYTADEYTATRTTIKGSTSYGQVTSTNSGAYPANGALGSYWYESAGSSTSWSQGTTNYGQVSSTSSSAYPNNGHSGSYWYVYSTSSTSYSQGSYITDVVSTDPNAYPSNGKSGSYWYVYDGVS